MRKTLTLFLFIQAFSFFIWITMPKNTQVMANEPALTTEAHAVSQVNNKVEIIFRTRNIVESALELNEYQKGQIELALSHLPIEHAQTIKNIVLDYNPKAHRGLGGNNLVILRGIGMDDKEFISVLVHETGHNVDYGYLTHENTEERSAFRDGGHSIYITDPSVDFYQISWEDEKTLKKTANNLDFVSGYAMTDPFEDFAETYTYYVLHNEDFKTLTASSPKLYAKYQFMKERVFNDAEFNTGDSQVIMYNRPWDTTVLSYDLEEFLS